MTRIAYFMFSIVTGLMLTLAPAHAGPCDKAASAYEAAICFDQEYQSVDKRLNEVYKKHRSGLDETAKTLFRDAQRTWITYRDAVCLNAADSSRGGTDSAIVGLRCQTILTQRRINDIEGTLMSEIQGRK